MAAFGVALFALDDGGGGGFGGFGGSTSLVVLLLIVFVTFAVGFGLRDIIGRHKERAARQAQQGRSAGSH